MASSMKGSMEEVATLRAENIALAEELSQCQADKEFVWSLWKRLQVASPDITQAVGLVVQREKEKGELKDRKVLSILQMKDDKIEQLQKTVASQSKDLSEVINKKLEQQDEINKLHAETSVLKDQLNQHKQQLMKQEEEILDKDDKRRQTIDTLKQEKQELEKRIEELTKEVAFGNGEKADLVAVKTTMDGKIKSLEAELNIWVEKHAKISKEHEESRKVLRRCEVQLRQHSKDIEGKNKELEVVRKELSEVWTSHRECGDHARAQDDIIRQLQALQHDTHQVLQNQETKRSLETKSLQQQYNELEAKYGNTLQTEKQLKEKINQLKENLAAREDELVVVRAQVEELEVSHRSIATQASILDQDVGDEDENSCRIQCLENEIDVLTLRLAEKNRIIQSLKNKDVSHRHVSLSPIHQSSPCARTPRSQRSRSPVRSKSASPQRHLPTKELNKKLETAEKKVKDCQKLLKLKGAELSELRTAHSNRLDRLKALQASYKLVREQLKTAEEELHGGKRKKKKVPTATLR